MHFIIKGLSPALDGLVVEGTLEVSEQVVVTRITNRDQIMGDRHVSYPIKAGTLVLSTDVLEETEDPRLREFSSKNPWGKVVCEGSFTRNGIMVSFAQYEQRMQVTVTDRTTSRSRTVFTHYFVPESFEKIKTMIDDSGRSEGAIEDLVFALTAAKTEETI